MLDEKILCRSLCKTQVRVLHVLLVCCQSKGNWQSYTETLNEFGKFDKWRQFLAGKRYFYLTMLHIRPLTQIIQDKWNGVLLQGKVHNTAPKTFSIKDFFSKCDQIGTFLRICSHLLKKSLMKNFISYAVYFIQRVLTMLYYTFGWINIFPCCFPTQNIINFFQFWISFIRNLICNTNPIQRIVLTTTIYLVSWKPIKFALQSGQLKRSINPFCVNVAIY